MTVKTPGKALFSLACVTLACIVVATISVTFQLSFAGISPAPLAIAGALAGMIGLIVANHSMDNAKNSGPITVSPRLPRADDTPAGLSARVARLEEVNAELLKHLAAVTADRDGLELQMSIDPLTGVKNRRGLEADFKALGVGTVFAMVDLDHFKAINDTLGHDVGDRVLKGFASMLTARLGESIPVYRIGGEEFVVLFDQTQMAQVRDTLDAFRRELEASNLVRATDNMSISFSAGLAQCSDAEQSFADIYKLADEQLYEAKSTGRGKTAYRPTTSGFENAGQVALAA